MIAAQLDLEARVKSTLNAWPAVGLAMGIVRDGRLESFHAEGVADIASHEPITEDTAFRIASVSKTFTAAAVLQLWERGLIDLDGPANDYLRAFRLVPARASWRPATVRHLLTHTAGIRELLHLSGLLHMRDLGDTVEAGRRVPPLAEIYRGGLRLDAEPGTRFMYSSHGFATLSQIVEDVTGMPLARYLRERVLEPLGMERTGFERPRSGVAVPYELRSGGPVAIADYEVISVGGGGLYSTPGDMARYLAALLEGGAGVLKPATVAMMFAPQYQPDPRIPGMGLSFFRADLGGHLAVEHDGILPGFDAQVFLAPDDGLAVMAFANGARSGLHWLTPIAGGLLRELLGVPDDVVRTDLPQHPEIWPELCGWYRFDATWSDPGKLALGPRTQVVVKGGRLVVRSVSPIAALRRGFVLHPDDEHDPYVFRIEIPWFGLGTGRVVFAGDAFHLDFAPMTFRRTGGE